jgi:hypothetical protein
MAGVDPKAALAEAERQRAMEEAINDEIAPRSKHGFRAFTPADLADPRYNDLPSYKYHNAIMKAKARIVHCFTRAITNDHSEEDAVQFLFETNHGAGGSGWLHEYIGPALRSYEARRKAKRKPA